MPYPSESVPPEDAVVAAFLQRVLRDEAAGERHPLEHYLRAFPGREDALRAVWLELDREEADTEPERVAGASGPGRRLGPYRLLELLGRGGQGDVHLALDERLGRRVAVKTLRGLGGASAEALRRFRREAEVASRLDHPGICAVYDTGFADGMPYIAMRYVEGPTLADVLRHERESAGAAAGLPPDPLARIALLERIARAVHAAHEAGVLHRDLKPGNVIVAPGDEPVILDFGLARMMECDDTFQTLTGEVFGTPQYLAPEQLESPPLAADRLTDGWALGVLVYESVAGRRPFGGATRERLYRAIVEEAPAPLPRRGLPRQLELVLGTALEKDRTRRYQTANDLAEDLRRVRCHEPILARPVSSWRRLERWAGRHPARAALVVLLAVVAGTAGFAIARWPAIATELAARERDASAESIERALEDGFIELTPGGDGVAARAAFERALGVDPGTVEATAGLVLLALREQRFSDAQDLLDSASRGPDSAHALGRLRAAFLQSTGRSEEARVLLEGFGPPDAALAAFVAALVEGFRATHEDREAGVRAIDIMERCLLVAPRARLVYHLEAVRAAVAAGRVERAREIADAAVGLWPSRTTAWVGAGSALVAATPRAAIGYLEEALRRDRLDRLARLWHAEALFNAGEMKEAAEVLDDMIDDGEDPGAWLLLSAVRERLGDSSGAVAAVEETVRIEPENAIAWGVLARLSGESGAWDRCAIAARRALRLLPRHYDAMTALQCALNELGELDEAGDVGARAIALRPELAEAYSNLATTHLHRGDRDRAIDLLEQALVIEPSSYVVLNNLNLLLPSSGRHRRHLEVLRHARGVFGTRAPSALPTLIADASRLAAIEDVLDAIRGGAPCPSSSAAARDVAGVAAAQGDASLAARLLMRSWLHLLLEWGP